MFGPSDVLFIPHRSTKCQTLSLQALWHWLVGLLVSNRLQRQRFAAPLAQAGRGPGRGENDAGDMYYKITKLCMFLIEVRCWKLEPDAF